MKLDEMLLQADQDHNSGLNCAQSVLKQFCQSGGLPAEKYFLRLSSGLGSGMKVGSVCGALSGGIMALGLHLGSEDPARKAEMDAPVRELVTRFRTTMAHKECNKIIGYDVSDPTQRAIAREKGIFASQCPLAIRTAVTIVYDILNRNQ